ncbi:MAG: QueT transporter family protein [Clostridia bacterium]|nr:QueT transporter family protein [Clostridia bacterium]
MKKSRIKHLAAASMIAALYAVLTLLSAVFGLAVGPFEFRLSEALCALPLLTPAAVPGLFCGCLAANLICGAALPDVIFGSVATLIGAVGTYVFRKKPLWALLCPVIANTMIIPPILYFVYGFGKEGFLILAGAFFVGEAVSAMGLGALLYRTLLPFQKHFE